MKGMEVQYGRAMDVHPDQSDRAEVEECVPEFWM